jgi:hypothetical protein
MKTKNPLAQIKIFGFCRSPIRELDTTTPPSPTWWRPREAPLMHVAKEDCGLLLFTVSSWQARPWRRRASPLSHKTIVAAKVSVDIDGVPKGAAFQPHGVSFAKQEPRPRNARGGVS